MSGGEKCRLPTPSHPIGRRHGDRPRGHRGQRADPIFSESFAFHLGNDFALGLCVCVFVSASYSFPSRLTIVRFYDRVIRRRGGFGCGDIVSAGLGWILGLLSSSKYGYYSGPDTNGERESVIVSEVSSFQRLKCSACSALCECGCALCECGCACSALCEG